MNFITKKNIQKIIKELEEQGKVISATNDFIFKGLFQAPSMKGVLVYVIHEVTKLNEEYLFNNMRFGNTEIGKENIALKNNTADLLVNITNKCILLEMNKYNTKENEFRNKSHFYSQIVKSIKVADTYEDIKEIYQINFDNEKALDDNLISEIMFVNIQTGRIEDKDYKKYRINLVKVREKYYNNFSKLSRFEKILLILQLDQKDELRKLAKGDEELMKMVDKIEDMSKDLDNVSLYDEEKLDKLAKSYGEHMAKEEGKAEGITLGKTEANLETARNLLAMNMSASDISKATGLSIEEVLALKNE